MRGLSENIHGYQGDDSNGSVLQFMWGEVEAYELIECVSCEQYFCEDCIDEGDMCFACTEADYEDGEEEEEDE